MFFWWAVFFSSAILTLACFAPVACIHPGNPHVKIVDVLALILAVVGLIPWLIVLVSLANASYETLAIILWPLKPLWPKPRAEKNQGEDDQPQ